MSPMLRQPAFPTLIIVPVKPINAPRDGRGWVDELPGRRHGSSSRYRSRVRDVLAGYYRPDDAGNSASRKKPYSVLSRRWM